MTNNDNAEREERMKNRTKISEKREKEKSPWVCEVVASNSEYCLPLKTDEKPSSSYFICVCLNGTT